MGYRRPHHVLWLALLLPSHQFAFDAATARISVGRNGYWEGNKTMSSPSIVHSRSLTRRSALGIAALALVKPSVSAFAQTPAILVHKDPDCGCCAGWVRHLEDAGFAVTVEDTTDIQPVRKRLGVPADLAACHTAEIDGYVLEGHVPAAAVRRLLEKRPAA